MKGRKRIEKLRKKINTIDLELLKLLNARAGVAIEVGKVKRWENVEFYSPIREREIYRRMSVLNKGPFPDSAVRDIFREIMSASLSLEKPLKVSFLGPHATFTHHAAIEHFGSSARFLPEKEISDVFDDVERGKALFGVVPIENTIEGAVSHTLDMLIQSNLKICAEVMTEVSLCLLSRTGKASGIARVASHPHAIKECARWL
ncbi:MAG TPA: chorismate mutase, partial [Thermodesulfobacteriota bacterium]|nr:chorismate mutase [Thermodesulfobacteriota bacterium]